MAQQYFVLGIGGTGMRCIESLIHLCAMGMFDDTDIHLLALDTDKDLSLIHISEPTRPY